MRNPSAFLMLSIAALWPAAASAQSLTGRLIDATDSAAVSGAEVIVSGERRVRSNGQGVFRVADLKPGRHGVSVRMLGYRVHSDSIDVVGGGDLTLDVYLARVPQLLSQMVVKGRSLRVLAGFEDVYRRANLSNGVLVTREQIDSLNPKDVVALVNATGPFRASPNRDSNDRLRSSRCQSFPGSAGGPPVTLFLNGVPLNNTLAINEILDHMAPSGIQAVEMYNGASSVPATFQPACGVIAIWTRRG